MATKQAIKLHSHFQSTKGAAKVERAVPNRPSTGFTGQIVDLEVGECVSRIGQLMPDMTLGEFAEQCTVLKANFRNNLMPSVRGAKAYTEGEYSVEVVTTVTTPGSIYLVGIVTRTA